MEFQEQLTSALLTMAAIFVLCKFVFGAIGFLMQGTDKEAATRATLDTAWEKLDQYTFPELFARVIEIITTRINSLRKKWKIILLLIFLSGALLNYTIIYYYTNYEVSVLADRWKDVGQEEVDSYKFTFLMLLISILVLSLIDIISIAITWMFLDKIRTGVASFRNIIIVLIEVTICFLVALIAIFLIFILSLGPIVDYIYSDTERGLLFYYEFVIDILSNDVGYIFDEASVYLTDMMIILLIVSSTLPTLFYISLEILVFTAKLTPDAIRRFLRHLIFQITTDKTPVFKTLGNIVGGTGVLISGIMNII